MSVTTGVQAWLASRVGWNLKPTARKGVEEAMADGSRPPEARRRADDVLKDWSPPTLDILLAIAQWYNGAVLERDNQRDHIGYRRLDLQTLLGCSDAEWEQRYEAAFTDLQAPATSPTLTQEGQFMPTYTPQRQVRGHQPTDSPYVRPFLSLGPSDSVRSKRETQAQRGDHGRDGF